MLRHRRRTVELPAEAAAEVRAGDPAEEPVAYDPYDGPDGSGEYGEYEDYGGLQENADPEEIRRRALAYLEAESSGSFDEDVQGAAPFEDETKFHTAHALYEEELEQEAMAYLNSETKELYNTRSFTQSLDEADLIGADLPEGPIHPSQRKRSDRIYDEVNPPVPRKKRKKKHYLLRFLVFLAIVGGSIGFLLSPVFDLETVTVEGNVNYTQEQIVEMSGLKTGKNLFRIHRNRVRDRLLEDSYIDSAKVHRELPHTISIIITEREELAKVAFGKEYVIIDKEGYVLKAVPAKNPPKVTTVQGLTVTDAEPGSHLTVEEEDKLQETLELLNAMQYSDIYFKTVIIEDGQILCYVYDKLLCKGTPDAVMENIKNGNLKKILYDLTRKKITKGTIYLNKGKYYSFSPKIEK